LGFKSVWANGKIVTNASVFYNDWQNLQQRRFFPDCGLGFISNVGSASSTGLELEVKAKAAKGLDLGMGLGLLNAKIKETGPGLDAEKDDRILFTPESTFNLNAQYTHELSNGNQFFVRGDLQNVGERYSVFNPEAAKERVLGAYTLANARVGYVFGKVEIALFCNNLTGEQANFGDVTSLAAETPGRPRYMTNRPRTVGLSGRYFF
jgi:iron complex outermembrane receptor protein